MKTTFAYDHYYPYAEYTAALSKLCESYPDLVTLESLAKTEEGRDVFALTLSHKSGLPSSDKPAYYIDANIHAGEVTSTMTALFTLDYLLTNHQDNQEIQQLLRDYTFYIIPRVSPDGAEQYLIQHEKLRSVNRLYPHTEKQDGLHPEDIDGDGVIRMMRIKTPYGPWKVSALDPRLLSKRLPNDLHGDFYAVYPEGYIQNYDGTHITLAPNKWGLDFNRNFPFGWYSDVRQPGAGKYPLSNPETKALVDFVLAHPNIGFVSTLHTTGGVLIYPPGTYSEKNAIPLDMKLYHDMGKLAKQLTGYETKNVFDEFLVDTDNYSSGAFDDWCYETQGIPAYTIELWDCLMRSGIAYDDIRSTHASDYENEANNLKTLKWVDENLSDGFKPWTTITHPELGEVEVGGFDFKFVIQNPPVQFLAQEVEKMGLYLTKSAFALPKLKLNSAKATPLGNSLYSLDLVISNTGFMDTNLTQKALIQKVSAPVCVTLEGCTDLEGKAITLDLGQLQGFGSIASHYGYDGITTTGTNEQIKTIQCVVRSESAQIEITLTHPKAGTVKSSLSLVE